MKKKTETRFEVQDSDSLAVLLRFVDCVGETVTSVVPINNGFAVSTTGDVDLHSGINLEPFKDGVDRRRTYSEIATVIK